MYYCCYCGHGSKDESLLKSIVLSIEESRSHWGKFEHCVHKLPEGELTHYPIYEVID